MLINPRQHRMYGSSVLLATSVSQTTQYLSIFTNALDSLCKAQAFRQLYDDTL